MNFWLNFPFKKFGTFVLGGGLSFFLKVFLTLLLTEVVGISYFTSYIISLSAIVGFGFFYNFYFTFKVARGRLRNFVKYVIALFTFNIFDAALVRILTEFVGIHYIVSIITVTTLIFLLKYIVYDKFVFTRRQFDKNSGKLL